MASNSHPPIVYWFLAATLTLVACGGSQQSEPAPTSASSTPLEDVVQQLAQSSDLPIVDMSVPFDRLQAAPAKLHELARRLEAKEPGLFVMRYYDDTLLRRMHVFHSGPAVLRYIVITSHVAQEVSRQQFEISAVVYEEATQQLLLQTRSHPVRLSAQDVTPVGA
ncbi:MAG: hypothetical protein ACR2PZ_26455 [Pseudomonadales bacterium]